LCRGTGRATSQKVGMDSFDCKGRRVKASPQRRSATEPQPKPLTAEDAGGAEDAGKAQAGGCFSESESSQAAKTFMISTAEARRSDKIKGRRFRRPGGFDDQATMPSWFYGFMRSDPIAIAGARTGH